MSKTRTAMAHGARRVARAPLVPPPSSYGTIGRPRDAPPPGPVNEGLRFRGGVKAPRLFYSRMKQFAMRNYKEHSETGMSLDRRYFRLKQSMFKKLYPKPVSCRKAVDLKAAHPLLQKADPQSYRGEYGMMLRRLHTLPGPIQQEMTHLYQHLRVAHYKDPSLSLNMTTLQFGRWVTVTVVTNVNPAYAYGKVFATSTKQRGRDPTGEVTVYDAYGSRTEFDRAGFRGVTMALLHAAKALRRVREKNRDTGQELAPESDAQKLLRTLPGGPKDGQATHAVSFADCIVDGDYAHDDLPGGLAALADEVDCATAAPDALVTSSVGSAAVQVAGEMYHSHVEFECDQLVKPIFSAFIEPWLHHMVSKDLLACLPESRYWRDRIEYIGSEHTRLFHSARLPQRPADMRDLIDNRSPYPEPPREFAKLEPLSAGKYIEIPSVAAAAIHKPRWSGDAKVYDRPWLGPDWTKGYLPKARAPPEAADSAALDNETRMIQAGLTKIA